MMNALTQKERIKWPIQRVREEDGAANHATFLKAPTIYRRSKTSEELPYIFTAPSKASTCKNYVSPINKKMYLDQYRYTKRE